MKKKIILGIKIENRKDYVQAVQHILTKYGCSIKTRIGLHEADAGENTAGIILLELCGDMKEIVHLEADLLNVPTIELQKMYFSL